MASSVIRSFFIPSVRFTIVLYAVFLILSDLTVTCSIATLGLIVSVLFFVQFSLPSNDKSRVERFFVGRWNSGRSCADREPSVPKYLVFVGGHRTLALEAPENSLSGIKKAADLDLDAVEFDVRWTRDGSSVLFHDATVDRITEGSGSLADLTLEQLRQLDLSAHHLKHDTYKGERVVTLAEAVAECLRHRLKMLIDVKEPDKRNLSALVDLYGDNPPLYDVAMVVCYSPLFLYQLRSKDPSILTGLVWRPRMVSVRCPTGVLEHGGPAYREAWKGHLATVGDAVVDWTYHALLWYACGAAAILPHKDAICREYLRFWKRREMRVLAWPVNDPLEKQYCAHVLGIGYLTDTHLPHP